MYSLIRISLLQDIQDWFTECAREIAHKRGENIEWVTPLGFPVVQPYSKLVAGAATKAGTDKIPVSYVMDTFM